ncbi:MAG: hypothetical protein A2X94_11335 [Bdellovibrionales bacterium GWB1_55_8]|nr:MAG: hypothetical protein A2X94_11335 [Bdellovibrionales bacterium GWB1_55_8]
MSARNPSVFSVFALCLLASTAAASDFHSPRTAGLGGAGRAGPIMNDAIYLNPSFGALLPSYSVSINALYFRGPATEPDGSSFLHGRNLNASVQDGRSELFQAGVGYTRGESFNFLHLGASRAFVKRFGFGIGAKLIMPRGEDGKVVRDGTLSVSLVASEWLQVVGLVDNLFESGTTLGLLREYALGTKINVSRIILFYFDPHIAPALTPASTFGHESGAEFVMASDLFLRVGAFRNAYIPFLESRADGYGLGLGWIGPRMQLDWGMTRALRPTAATSHIFGATLYF